MQRVRSNSGEWHGTPAPELLQPLQVAGAVFNDYAVTAEGELVEEFFIVAALVTLSTAAYPPCPTRFDRRILVYLVIYDSG